MKKFILICILTLGFAMYGNAQTERGFKVMAEAGFTRGTLEMNGNAGNLFDNVIDVTGTVGYQFNKTLMVGVGSGAEYYVNTEAFSIPVFADVHVNLAEGTVVPYLALKGGYSFYTESELNGNIFVTPAVGLKLQNKLFVSLGYNYQWADVSDMKNFHNQGIVARVGWIF